MGTSESLARLMALAGRQHGVISRKDAHDAGVTNKVLATLERRGIVTRLTEQVFVATGSQPTLLRDMRAAIAAGAGRCAVTGRTAAALHGFDGYRLDRQPVDLLVKDRGRSFTWPGATLHYTVYYDFGELMDVDGICVTDPIRTWFSLCAIERWPEDAEDALDAAERDGLIERDEVIKRLREWREMGRNGVRVAEAILDRRIALESLPATKLERKLLRLLERGRIVAGVCQYPVVRDDGKLAYLDVAWPPLRLGAETDGHGAHATRTQRSNDHRRQNELLGNFEIVRFTSEDVVRNGDYVIRTLRRRIRARAIELGLEPATFFLSGVPERLPGAGKAGT